MNFLSLWPRHDSILLWDGCERSRGTRRMSRFVSPFGTSLYSPTSPAAITAANSFGGGDSTIYMAVVAQSSWSSVVSFSLNTPAKDFGLWFTAGDGKKVISFYVGYW